MNRKITLSKNKYRYLIYPLIIILAIELFLRFYYGFCDTVLMQDDPDYEYIAQPNQNRFRFRNHVRYNAESMRSNEVDTSAYKILGFGDSVINGGVQTDQDSLATTILSDSLSHYVGRKVQVLNISAGSWGPDNCYAYLKKHGNFNAKAIFLFVSSHDAYDIMTFQKIIDKDVSFPSKQPFSAIYELVDRYALPKLKEKLQKQAPPAENLVINKKTESSPFNAGFEAFYNYSVQNKIPLMMYLHAEQSELRAGQYNEQGQLIIQFALEHKIPLIKDLDHHLTVKDFRDDIHINATGQRDLATAVLSYLKAEGNFLLH